MLNFSIIIPTYNRPERLKTCLASLNKLNYHREGFEVIVVDDGSHEPLDNYVKPYKEWMNITLIRQNNAGPAQARNKGATLAKGRYLAFTDDDCTLDVNWLSAFEEGFLQNPEALLGGKTLNNLKDNIYSTSSQLLIDFMYEYYNSRSQTARFFASNNFALARELFNAVGQFNMNFPLAAGEDREFCDRWLFSGYSLAYIPSAIVYHNHELNLAKFWHQHFNYGCGAFYFRQISAERSQAVLKVEPLSFYWNLLTYPLVTKSQFSKPFLFILLFISQLANSLGFFVAKYSGDVA